MNSGCHINRSCEQYLLCRERNKAIVEYALRDIQKPIGVSDYQLTRALSEDLKGRLPSIEEIEKD